MTDNQSKELFGQTPSQTVGPFFHYSLPWKGGADLVGRSSIGARPDLIPLGHYLLQPPSVRSSVNGTMIEIVGRVLDGESKPVPDAMIEIWQANAAGRYRSSEDGRDNLPLDEGFQGFGRSSTGEDGEYRFLTVLPGRVPGPGNSLQAPHIAVGVFARGLLRRLATRIYFENGEGLDQDPILELVPTARRDTLIARRISDTAMVYRFDIILQGEGETVFFDF